MVKNQKNLDKVNVIFVQKLLSYINTYRLRLRFIQLGSVSVYGASKYTLGSSNYISEKVSLIQAMSTQEVNLKQIQLFKIILKKS